MTPAYPTFSILAAIIVVVAELRWFRTGLFRQRSYWVSMSIVFAFMIPVDAWMTKLSAPIVIYNPNDISGYRFPLDIPTEEVVYAFALLTLTMALWDHHGVRS